MSAANPRTDPPAPAPGGTAILAGRTVARIGFGTLQLEHAAAGRDAALAVLRQAIHEGVNHLDTAQFYGAGTCNSLLRDALAPYPDNLVLVSKVGADNDADGALIPTAAPISAKDARPSRWRISRIRRSTRLSASCRGIGSLFVRLGGFDTLYLLG